MKTATKTSKYFNREFFMDLAFLGASTFYVLVQGFEIPPLDAVLYSPLALGGSFLGLYLVVRVIGLLLDLCDCVSNRLSIRRSPLA